MRFRPFYAGLPAGLVVLLLSGLAYSGLAFSGQASGGLAPVQSDGSGATDENDRSADDPQDRAAFDAPRIRRVEFNGAINVINQRRITRAVEEANANSEDLILIELDTPGGAVVALDEIVKAILNSEVPVVVWVGPSGARAASAGFFVLLSADVAAMAPGTRTGAASTVFGDGSGSDDNVLLKKANEDGAALLRSIAERRGRDVEAAERAVFEAKSYEEQVALELGLCDRIAPSVEALLADLDGETIQRFDGTEVAVRTTGAVFVESQFSARHVFMELLANPLIASLLLMGGLAGLYFELTNPGAIFPGVLGGLCLLLFFISAQTLPISVIGVLMILFAIALFVLEIKITSFGLLTVAGTISLGVGLWMLIDSPIPEMRLSPGFIIPLTLTIAAFCAFSLRLAIRAQRERVDTGVEGLVGRVGRVTRPLEPDGKVFIHGEIWNASSTSGRIERDAQVRVVAVESLRLRVEPVDAAGVT